MTFPVAETDLLAGGSILKATLLDQSLRTK